MKPINKFYIILIALSLIFWNPLSFYFIYRNTDVYNDNLLKTAFWVILLLGIAVIIALLKNRLERFKNFSLSFALAGIVLSMFILLDGAISLFSPGKRKDHMAINLIFEANTIASYKTTEFDFEAKISSIGLRNKEISIEKGNKFRILCLGDSWTFGWGVEMEDAWPARLEKYLINAGYHNTEVINCGESGQYPGTYENLSIKLVPLLKPDLVLAGLLQADDLAQCYEFSENIFHDKKLKKGGVLSGISGSLKLFYRISFKNLLYSLRSNRNKVYNIKAEWKTSSELILDKLNNLQRKRYETLDDSLKMLISTGNLNPGLLQYYLYFPDRFFVFNNPSNKATRVAAGIMEGYLAKTRNICSKENAGLVIINLPESSITGHKTQSLTNILENDYLLKHNHVDSIYASIAKNIDVPYLEMTNRFKSLSSKTGYFYNYDGHPTARGYNEMANAIGEFLISEHLVKP